MVQCQLNNMRSNPEPLEAAREASAKIMKRPWSDCRSDFCLCATMVAKRMIGTIDLPVLGNVSSTRQIIGVMGIVCGKPFLVRVPCNSIVSAVISSRANSVISFRRAPDRIKSLISALAARPLHRPLAM